MKRMTTLFVTFLIFTGLFIILDADFDMITMKAKADTLYVGSGPGNDSTTIQGAINMADPGDTIFVHSGEYKESADGWNAIRIDKTITLVGEDKETTIVNASGKTNGILIEYSDYVNISGFTVTSPNGCNIELLYGNHTHIFNNILKDDGCGISLAPGYNNILENNIITDNLNGIIVKGHSSGNILRNNEIKSSDIGISIQTKSNDNLVYNNTIIGYDEGIYIKESTNIIVENNMISDGNEGLSILEQSSVLLLHNTISNNDIAVKVWDYSSATIVNSTLQNSDTYDIKEGDLGYGYADVTLINTSFNSNKIIFDDETSTLIVQLYLHVKVVDEVDEPLEGITVQIRDNENGDFDENYTTNSQGYVNWVPLTHYIENKTTKVYYSPYNVTASDLMGIGFASPEVTMDQNKEIIIKVIYENNPPEITVIGPTTKNPKMKEDMTLKFSIDESDPDPLDTLEIIWYIDDVVVQTGGSSFTYHPNSSNIGEHVVRVVVDDGTDNVEYSWNLTVEEKEAPPSEREPFISNTVFFLIVGGIIVILLLLYAFIFNVFIFLKRKIKPTKLEDEDKENEGSE